MFLADGTVADDDGSRCTCWPEFCELWCHAGPNILDCFVRRDGYHRIWSVCAPKMSLIPIQLPFSAYITGSGYVVSEVALEVLAAIDNEDIISVEFAWVKNKLWAWFLCSN